MVDETVLEGLSTRDHFFLKILQIRLESVREFFSTRFEGPTLSEIDSAMNELRAFAVGALYEDQKALEDAKRPAIPLAETPAIEAPEDLPIE